MTPVDSPHVLLTRAADLIEDLAASSEPGRWVLEHPGKGHAWINTGGYDHAWGMHGFVDEARWVATLSPAVAPHLVAWLRREAEAGGFLDRDGRLRTASLTASPSWA